MSISISFLCLSTSRCTTMSISAGRANALARSHHLHTGTRADWISESARKKNLSLSLSLAVTPLSSHPSRRLPLGGPRAPEIRDASAVARADTPNSRSMQGSVAVASCTRYGRRCDESSFVSLTLHARKQKKLCMNGAKPVSKYLRTRLAFYLSNLL